MDAPQNSGNDKKPQLSWAQPISSVKPTPMKSVQVPPKKDKDGENHTMRNLIITVVAILVVMGIAWAITGNKKDSDAVLDTTPSKTAGKPSGAVVPGTPSSTAQASFPSGSLVITSPQNAGLEIAVSNVAVQVPTWVVIYENYNGQPGNVLGAALFTKDRSSGVVDLLRGTLPGQSYFAGEARDDGDHMFSMANDPATRDANGNPITLKFETK